MNNKEAVEILKNIIEKLKSPIGCFSERYALGLAIKALEKQEPKLVKGISFTYDGSVGNCPDCNSFVDDRNNSIICKCGQKLLWEEVRDDK